MTLVHGAIPIIQRRLYCVHDSKEARFTDQRSAIRDMTFSSFTLPSATSQTDLSDGESYLKSMGWTYRIPLLMIPKVRAESDVYSASAGFYADLTRVH